MKKLFSALLFVAGSASAADLSTQLLACSEQSDSLKRLVCFDAIASKVKAGGGDVKSGQSTPVKTAAQTAPVNAVAVTPTPAAVEKTHAAQTTRQSAEDIFGKESLKKLDVVDEVRFVVKSASLSLRKKWRFTFENGQKWEQKDSDKFAKFEAGDEVIIKRGVMNAFYLKKPDANRTIRVKRVK